MDMEELGYFIFMEEQEEKRNKRMENGRRNASRLLYSSKRSISDGSKSSSNVASFSQNS